MAKKINIIANLIDTQLKKQLADIEKGKYKLSQNIKLKIIPLIIRKRDINVYILYPLRKQNQNNLLQ